MPDPTVRYVYGQRLDRLAERLADELAAAPLDDPLASEIVIVPHPGMGRWLQQFLARRWGIATLLDTPSPARFAWDLLRRLDGALPDQSGYEREPLSWRIHALLPRLARQPGCAPIAAYLDADDPLKGYELALRLATIIEQYLVYRPAWLERWQRGDTIGGGAVAAHEGWQAPLWRALREAIGEPSRAELIAAAIGRVRAPRGVARAALPPRVAVLGVSTLPPLYLEFLAALGTRVPVSWYHVNPSAHYWGNIVLPRERARQLELLARQGIAEPDAHLESGHPLLAAWGKLGRDFLELYGQAHPIYNDEAVAGAADGSLLDWIKASLGELDAQRPPPALDHSLRVHACASRLREVEVLHDALLACFERDPTLTPRDIVVMTPRLTEYAPLVEAVFGSAPDALHIPYTLADRTAAQSHPLLRALQRLLALPQSRLTASEVLDLLAVPAIARRLRLGGDDEARVARWLHALRVRWGLDGADRERAGAAPYHEYAWRPALDALVMGYACAPGDELIAGVLPYAEIEGQTGAAAGALTRFVERLDHWRERLARPRPARDWQLAIDALLGELFDEARADAAEIEARRLAYAAVADWVDAVRRGGAEAERLDAAVMRAAVGERLETPERRQRLLSTGVTVCAMVPMRNVPFRVVCLLGMDDGEFPRREPAASFNLMRMLPAVGDRSLLDDDRYLFLEALLAAGTHLHVSYRSRNERDGSPRPPASTVHELVEFVVGAYVEQARGWAPSGAPAALEDEARRVRAALCTEHPAAAYDPRNYLDPASFDRGWLGSARALRGPRLETAPFCSAVPSADAAPAAPGEVALADLHAYYRNPPRDYCRRVLEIELRESRAPEDDEPFELDALEGYALRQALIERLLREPDVDERRLQAWLHAQNLLRPGQLGELDYAADLAAVHTQLAQYRALLAAAGAAPRTLAIERRVGRWRVTGTLAHVLPRGPLQLRAGNARGGDWIALGVAARLLDADEAWLLGFENRTPFARRLDAASLRDDWLEAVLDTYERSRREFVPLLRYASWAYAQALPDTDAARRAAIAKLDPRYAKDDQFVEIGDPQVGLLLRGRVPPVDAAFHAAAQTLLAPLAAAIGQGVAR